MKTVFTESAPTAIGPYSQAKIAGGFLFASGQIPVNPLNGLIEQTPVEGQTRQVCENIAALLKAAGSSFEKVIKTTCFLADIKDFTAFNNVYGQYFLSKPARSCVAVKDIPKNCLVEIEVIADI